MKFVKQKNKTKTEILSSEIYKNLIKNDFDKKTEKSDEIIQQNQLFYFCEECQINVCYKNNKNDAFFKHLSATSHQMNKKIPKKTDYAIKKNNVFL